MSIEISKEHKKALAAIRKQGFYGYSTKKIIEHLIENHICRERGRLGRFAGNRNLKYREAWDSEE